MAVQFISTSSQYMSIAAPRPEFSGVSDYTVTCWLRVPDTFAAAAPQDVWAFSSGVSAAEDRVSGQLFGNTGGFTGSLLSVHEIRRTDGGSAGTNLRFESTPGQWNRLVFLAYNMTAVSTGQRVMGMGASVGSISSSSSGGGGVHSGPTTATASLAASIGASADGLAKHFDTTVEDLRVYNRVLTDPELRKIGLMRSADQRSALFDSDMLLNWRLKGGGLVTAEADRVSGVVATAVGAPVYVEIGTRRRRRNRGG